MNNNKKVTLPVWIDKSASNSGTQVSADNLNAMCEGINQNASDINSLSDVLVLLDKTKFDKVMLEGNNLKFYAKEVEKFSITLPGSGEIDLTEINNSLATKYDNVILEGQNLKFYVGEVLKKTIALPVGEGGPVDLSAYQTKRDENLTTTEKEIVAAINEVASDTSQITINKNKTTYTTYNEELKKPIVTFLDDDGNAEIMTLLKPVFVEKNVPCNCAIIPELLNTPRFITDKNVEELNSLGWGILGHNEADLTTLESSQLEKLISDTSSFFKNKKITADAYVFPANKSNELVRKVVKSKFNFAFSNVGIGFNGNTLRIPRIAFGSWTGNNPTINGNSEKNTLEYYKSCVDYAFDNNLWLTFMVHCAHVENGHTEEQQALLSPLIDYIKSKNIKIGTVYEAYKMHGNNIFSGDYEGDFFSVRDGVLNTNVLHHVELGYDSLDALKGIDSFDYNTITKTTCTQKFATTNKLPDNYPGILITYKCAMDSEYQLNRQEYITFDNVLYVRKPTSLTEWGTWKKVYYTMDEIKNATSDCVFLNGKSSSDPISSYPASKISFGRVAASSGFPATGILITYNVLNSSGWGKQVLYVYGSNRVFERAVNEDKSWTTWEEKITLTKISVSVPEITIPANSQVDHEITTVGVNLNSCVSGSPSYGINAKVLYNVFSTEDGKIIIRLTNLDSVQVVVSTRKWNITYC